MGWDAPYTVTLPFTASTDGVLAMTVQALGETESYCYVATGHDIILAHYEKIGGGVSTHCVPVIKGYNYFLEDVENIAIGLLTFYPFSTKTI